MPERQFVGSVAAAALDSQSQVQLERIQREHVMTERWHREQSAPQMKVFYRKLFS